MKTEILGRLREEEGQGLVEYALILVLVAVAAVAGLTLLGGSLSSLFQTVASSI
jgi:pilus assembly protein Flp/PilA